MVIFHSYVSLPEGNDGIWWLDGNMMDQQQWDLMDMTWWDIKMVIDPTKNVDLLGVIYHIWSKRGKLSNTHLGDWMFYYVLLRDYLEQTWENCGP